MAGTETGDPHVKKFLKIALIVLGAVIVLITAAALIVPRMVNPNQYKGRISKLVKEKTGRDLTIEGDISISVFPWLGAKIGAVKLGNAPGFEGDTFAGVREVQVKVKLLPLLSKKVEADVVQVQGLVLNLERSADGKTNWDDLIVPSAAPSEEQPVKPEETQTNPSPLAALAVGGLDIQDARITWTDQRSGTHITLKNLNIKTSKVTLKEPVSVNLGFDLDTGEMGLAATAKADTRIEFDLDAGRYAAKDLNFRADLSGKAIPGGSATVSAGGNAAFDTASQKFDFSGIELKASGLNIAPYVAEAGIKTSGAGDLAAGSIHLKDLSASATLTEGKDRITAALSATADADLNAQRFEISNIALNIPELSMKGLQGTLKTDKAGSAVADLSKGAFNLDNLALSGTLSGEAVPGGPMPVSLNLAIKGDLNRKNFKITPLKLSAGDIHTTADLDLTQQESGPEIKGTLAVAAFNPRELLTRLGITLPKTADGKAISSAAFSTDIIAGTDAARLENLQVSLDDSKLTGTLGVKNFKAPDATFDLALDQFQLKRYLPPGSGEGASKLLSDITLKGALTADAGFKVFQVTRLTLSGKMDKKIPFGLSAADTRLDLDKQTLSAAALTLTADKMTLKAKADVTGLSSAPAYTAQLQTDTFNLRQILSNFNLLPETADAKAMSAVALAAAVKGSTQAVSVSSLKLRLDNTNITGKADVTLAPAPAYAFDIAVDDIDADRYLPPPAPETTGKNKAPQAATTPPASATPLPVDLIRGLNLDGKIAIGKLKIKKIRLSGIKIQAAAKEGLVTLNPLNADLYDGSSSGSIRLDARGKTPALSLDETLAGVQSGNLLKDLQGDAIMTGLAGADIKLTSAGADTNALLSSLGGTVSFTFSDGSIKGVDIVGELCQALTAVSAGSLKTEDLVGTALQMLAKKTSKTKTTTTQLADSTSFSELGGSMTFANGVGTSKDLSLKSPLLRVSGAGTVNLPKQRLDYDATASLVKSCQGQGGKSTDDLKNVPIPVTISGPFTNLKVKPNLTAGILEILNRKQNKQTSKTSTTESNATSSSNQTQEKPEKVEDAVKGLLQDLLKK